MPEDKGQVSAAKQHVDGFMYSNEATAQINDLCHGVLTSPGGHQLLNYMRKISVNRVLLPNASDAELRHIEGARWLVAVLEGRRDDHERYQKALVANAGQKDAGKQQEKAH